MEKNKISAYFLFISIFTLVTIFFFVVQKSYNNLIKPAEIIKKSDLLKPVEPNLDTSVLDEIEQRKYFPDSESEIIPTEEEILMP